MELYLLFLYLRIEGMQLSLRVIQVGLCLVKVLPGDHAGRGQRADPLVLLFRPGEIGLLCGSPLFLTVDGRLLLGRIDLH